MSLSSPQAFWISDNKRFCSIHENGMMLKVGRSEAEKLKSVTLLIEIFRITVPVFLDF